VEKEFWRVAVTSAVWETEFGCWSGQTKRKIVTVMVGQNSKTPTTSTKGEKQVLTTGPGVACGRIPLLLTTTTTTM